MEGEKAQSYLKDCERYTDYMVSDLYQSETELKDLLLYLSNDPQVYLGQRLDQYSHSDQFTYQGFERLVQKAAEGNTNLLKVEIVGYEKQKITSFSPDGNRASQGMNSQDLERMSGDGLWAGGRLSFGREIRDPSTLKSPGYMLAVYDQKPLEDCHAFFPEGQLVVFGGPAGILYSSVPAEEAGGLIRSYEKGSMTEDLEMRASSIFYEQQVGAYTLAAWMPGRSAGRLPWSVILLICGSAAVVILFGIVLVHLYLKRLSLRLYRILDGMEEVTRGNLDVRIRTEDKKDELDVISEHFNHMCGELDAYIEKSYQAELDQKNAEMAALQSQINPHFLYNTLESIRMKAICNGDREVGKLLYGLAVLFRSQLKEADVINLAQELRYCKKYLELFEFRYQQKFHASVDCPEEYLQQPVIKFVVQPIIENYFEHGIRMEADDNTLDISVRREEGEMRIYVEDNGYGMEEAQLREKNQELSENKNQDKGSIGLTNVNRRLKAAYGHAYGVSIHKRPERGLCVILHFPAEGGA